MLKVRRHCEPVLGMNMVILKEDKKQSHFHLAVQHCLFGSDKEPESAVQCQTQRAPRHRVNEKWWCIVLVEEIWKVYKGRAGRQPSTHTNVQLQPLARKVNILIRITLSFPSFAFLSLSELSKTCLPYSTPPSCCLDWHQPTSASTIVTFCLFFFY